GRVDVVGKIPVVAAAVGKMNFEIHTVGTAAIGIVGIPGHFTPEVAGAGPGQYAVRMHIVFIRQRAVDPEIDAEAGGEAEVIRIRVDKVAVAGGRAAGGIQHGIKLDCLAGGPLSPGGRAIYGWKGSTDAICQDPVVSRIKI